MRRRRALSVLVLLEFVLAAGAIADEPLRPPFRFTKCSESVLEFDPTTGELLHRLPAPNSKP